MTNSADIMTYWILISITVALISITIYILKRALSVLHENGKELTFNFPVFNQMTHNGKTVGIVILLIVVTGIIWAIKS